MLRFVFNGKINLNSLNEKNNSITFLKQLSIRKLKIEF